MKGDQIPHIKGRERGLGGEGGVARESPPTNDDIKRGGVRTEARRELAGGNGSVGERKSYRY